MRVVLKVQRQDGQYIIRELDVSDYLDPEGVMMTKEQMVIGHTFRSMYGEVKLLPSKQEADEL